MSDDLDSAYDFYFDRPTYELSLDRANFAPQPGRGLNRTCKVGSYRPNRLGLYDMHGNVAEWCDDGGPESGDGKKARRGGGWNFPSPFCRACSRTAFGPSTRDINLGLRLARVPAVPGPGAPPH